MIHWPTLLAVILHSPLIIEIPMQPTGVKQDTLSMEQQLSLAEAMDPGTLSNQHAVQYLSSPFSADTKFISGNIIGRNLFIFMDH